MTYEKLLKKYRHSIVGRIFMSACLVLVSASNALYEMQAGRYMWGYLSVAGAVGWSIMAVAEIVALTKVPKAPNITGLFL